MGNFFVDDKYKCYQVENANSIDMKTSQNEVIRLISPHIATKMKVQEPESPSKKSLQPKVYKAGEDRFISVKTFLIRSGKNVQPVNFRP